MLKKIRQLITDVLLFLVVITALLLFLFSMASAEQVTNDYLPTPQQFMANENIEAIDLVLEALNKSFMAGRIQEVIRCPCYEIIMSSDSNRTFLRVENEQCK